jgi:hypothetical protein
MEGVEGKLTSEPYSTSMRRIGLRRNYQRGCPLVLYGKRCRAPKVTISCIVNAYSGNILSVMSTTVIPIMEAYSGGIIQWTDPISKRTEIRTILSCDGNGKALNVRISGPVRNVPTTVDIIKGCVHTEDACINWHNNIVNFGGQPWIPLKSPFNSISEYF